MHAILERATHWKTSTAGLAAGGALAYVLTSWGCALPSDWSVWAVSAIPALVGILSRDSEKGGPA